MPGIADPRLPGDRRPVAIRTALLLVFFLVLAASPAAWASGGHEAAEEHPLGVLHPLLVHFPLALALVAALAVVLGLVFRGRFFRDAVTFTITLAAFFAVPTWLLGREAAASMGRMTATRAGAVSLHETWGTIAAATLLGAAVLHGLRLLRPASTALGTVSRLGILAAAAVVSAAGYFGAEVTRGPGHLEGLWPF